jgi:hypothetical protein
MTAPPVLAGLFNLIGGLFALLGIPQAIPYLATITSISAG